MIRFPSTAYVGRTMPKEAFYKQLNLSAELREKFVSDVRRITMEYALTAESIHVDKSDELLEILVLTIQLKKQSLDYRIVETIARQNKHKLIFVLDFEGEQQLALYSGKLYKTPWLPAAEIKLDARGANIPEIWTGFIEQIALTDEKPAAAPLSIEERLRRQEQIEKLRKEIAKLEQRTRKEMQPKIKFELYQQMQKLKKQLEEIENGEAENAQ